MRLLPWRKNGRAEAYDSAEPRGGSRVMNWEWPRHEKDWLPPSPPRFARFGKGSMSLSPTPTPPPAAEPCPSAAEPCPGKVDLSETFMADDDFDLRALEDEKAEHFLESEELPQLTVSQHEVPVFSRSGVQVLRDDESAPPTDWLCCAGGGANDITAAQLCMGSGPGVTYEDAMLPPPGDVLGAPRHPVEFASRTPDSHVVEFASPTPASTPPRAKEAAKRSNYQPPKRAKPEDAGIQWA